MKDGLGYVGCSVISFDPACVRALLSHSFRNDAWFQFKSQTGTETQKNTAPPLAVKTSLWPQYGHIPAYKTLPHHILQKYKPHIWVSDHVFTLYVLGQSYGNMTLLFSPIVHLNGCSDVWPIPFISLLTTIDTVITSSEQTTTKKTERKIEMLNSKRSALYFTGS